MERSAATIRAMVRMCEEVPSLVSIEKDRFDEEVSKCSVMWGLAGWIYLDGWLCGVLMMQGAWLLSD
jgi:hypothetical protein